MEFLGLHIHHLDEGEEADEIVEILTAAFSSEGWEIERPTEETNSILVPVHSDHTGEKSHVIRSQMFDRAVVLLEQLTTETIASIKANGLSVEMRIHSDDGLLPIPATFVAACGRLNLGIYICQMQALLEVTEGLPTWRGRRAESPLSVSYSWDFGYTGFLFNHSSCWEVR